MRITKYFDGSNPMSNELSKYIEPPKIHGFTNIFLQNFCFHFFIMDLWNIFWGTLDLKKGTQPFQYKIDINFTLQQMMAYFLFC